MILPTDPTYINGSYNFTLHCQHPCLLFLYYAHFLCVSHKLHDIVWFEGYTVQVMTVHVHVEY